MERERECRNSVRKRQLCSGDVGFVTWRFSPLPPPFPLFSLGREEKWCFPKIEKLIVKRRKKTICPSLEPFGVFIVIEIGCICYPGQLLLHSNIGRTQGGQK